MVLTSGINMQLEQLFKMLEPKEFPMQNLPQYKEVECLGFQLSDMQVNFRKNFLEINCGYKKVGIPSDPEVCENFLDALKHGPKKFMDGATDMFGSMQDKFKNRKELPDEDFEEPPKQTNEEL